MSKDISIRVSAKMYDILKERAAANKIAIRELASVFFHHGFQVSVEALKQEQIKARTLVEEATSADSQSTTEEKTSEN